MESSIRKSRAPGPAARRREVASWRPNFATTDALAARLETMRRFYRPRGAFGLDVLGRKDVHGRRVLEIGPGTGGHAAALLARTKARPSSWTLVDRSEAMACAAARAIAVHAPTRALVGDADRLPIAADARFDVIVAMHVLPFVASPRETLRRAASHLARGGRVLVTAPIDDDCAEVRRLIRAVLRRRGLPWRGVASLGHSRKHAAADLRALFRRVVFHRQDGALEFPTAAPAVRYFASMAWLADVPAAARREVEREIGRLARHEIERAGVFRVSKGGATFVASAPR